MRCIVLACAATAAFPAAASLAQNANIGLASAAKNEVIVVGDASRGLKAGDTIFQNQHIRTGRDSAAQLLFRDETALTMGPNSSLVLDKAVYDPEKHKGEITVRAVSGAFRFISGSSPTGSYSINTPAGTVGIRGTWIEMLVVGQTVRILVRRGVIQFCNLAGQCARVIAGYELRGTHNRIAPASKVSHETVESIVALWFSENSEANLNQLAPGSGPGEGDQGNAGAGKPFWWLSGVYRDRDYQFNRGGVTGTTLPGDIGNPGGNNPPPPSQSILKLPTGSPYPGSGTPSGLVNNPGAPHANKPSGNIPPGQLKKN
jgi:hypothetical protein